MRKTGTKLNLMLNGKKIAECTEVEIETSKDAIPKKTKMTYEQALKKLGIEDYSERIFNSNSHGELFHLQDYILLAEIFTDTNTDVSWFKGWFDSVVKYAEEEWKRPESVFQHIGTIVSEQIGHNEKKD